MIYKGVLLYFQSQYLHNENFKLKLSFLEEYSPGYFEVLAIVVDTLVRFVVRYAQAPYSLQLCICHASTSNPNGSHIHFSFASVMHPPVIPMAQ